MLLSISDVEACVATFTEHNTIHMVCSGWWEFGNLNTGYTYSGVQRWGRGVWGAVSHKNMASISEVGE